MRRPDLVLPLFTHAAGRLSCRPHQTHTARARAGRVVLLRPDAVSTAPPIATRHRVLAAAGLRADRRVGRCAIFEISTGWRSAPRRSHLRLRVRRALRCASDSGATNHDGLDLTVLLGYGNKAREWPARRRARRDGRGRKPTASFVPPVPLKWLSSDNDRLYREADVIVVTVPGRGTRILRASSTAPRSALATQRSSKPVSAAHQFWRPRGGADRAPALRAVVDTGLAGAGTIRTCAGPWPVLRGVAVARGAAERDAAAGMSMRDAAFALLGRVARTSTRSPTGRRSWVRNATVIH